MDRSSLEVEDLNRIDGRGHRSRTPAPEPETGSPGDGSRRLLARPSAIGQHSEQNQQPGQSREQTRRHESEQLHHTLPRPPFRRRPVVFCLVWVANAFRSCSSLLWLPRLPFPASSCGSRCATPPARGRYRPRISRPTPTRQFPAVRVPRNRQAPGPLCTGSGRGHPRRFAHALVGLLSPGGRPARGSAR